MDDFSDAIDQVFPQGGAPAPPAPAAVPAAPRQFRDMDGTDMGPDTSVGPDLREPVPEGSPAAQVASEPGGASDAGPEPTSATPVLDQVRAQVHRQDAGPRDDYGDAIEQVFPDQQKLAARAAADAGFIGWKAANAGVEPQKALEVLRLADASGMAPEDVASNIDAVRKVVGAQEPDWQGVLQRAPALKDWLGENGIRPAAVKDDLDNLSLLEWAFKGPTVALIDGTKDLWSSARKFADATGMGGAANEQKISQLEAEQQDHGDYGAHNFFTKSMVGLAKTAPLLLLDQGVRFLAGGVAGKILGLGGAAAAEVAGLGPEDPLADAGAAASLLGGEKVATELGSFGLNAAISYANTNYELKKITGPDGQPLDPAVRQVLALTVGTINGGIMAVGGVGGHLLGPGAEAVDKEILNREGIEAAKRLLMDPTKLAALQRYARRFGVHEASALLIGGAQSGISDVADQIAKLKTGHAHGFSAKELMDTAWDGAWKTANDMMLLSAGNAALETRTDVANASVARELLTSRGKDVATTQSAERLQAINQAAQGQTVQGLSQKGIQDLVRKMGNQAVHIDSAAVKKLATERGVDPADLAKRIAGDDGSAWAQAERTGGDLVAPGGGYLEFARKDGAAAQALFPDSRLNADALTPRQHAEGEAAFQRRAAELAKAPPDAYEEGTRRVYDDFRTKALFAGIDPAEADASARQVAAFAGARAEQFAESGGALKDAWSVYQLQDLRITGPDGRSLGVGDFSKGASVRPGPPDHEAVKDVRAQYEKLLNTPGQEEAMRAYFQDPVTGLRNERAAQVHDISGNWQTLHFSVEGVKFRNDDLEKGGHNKADELLRAVAQAAQKVSPDTYRAGGDFAVPVANQADADAFLEQVRKNLPKEARGYGITGAVGDDLASAREAHDLAKDAAEKAGTRSSRGERPKGLPEGQDVDTHIAGRKVKAELGVEHQQRFAALTATRAGRDEAFKTVHIAEKGGVLTRQAFDARPQKKYRAAIDLNGLKRVQEKLALHMPKEDARAFGDLMLEKFGQLARLSKGLDFDFAHDHGDEYLAQSDDEQHLKAFLEELRTFARDVEVRAEATKDGVGGTWTYKRLMFGFGTGEARDENAAEKALNADKLALSTAGDRGNEDQPGRLDFIPGGPDGGGEDHGEAGAVDPGDQGGLGGHDGGGAGSGSAAGGGGLEDAGAGAAAGGGAGEGQGRGGEAADGSGRGVDAASGLSNVDRASAAWKAVEDSFGLHSKGGRGRVDFTPPGGKRRSFDIRILERADKSTLAHETFHFLNQVMGDLAQRADAPAMLKADYDRMLKFGGWQDHAQRVADDLERRALDERIEKGHKLTATKEARRIELHAKEEKLTYGWEQYLVEGKAPSADLVGTFSRFRNWLTDIYRKVAGADGSAARGIQAEYRRTYGQEINLSDDVREVFDRILASDAEVKRAAAASEAARPFDEMAAKMTPAERDDYERRSSGAQERARNELVRRLAENTHRDNVGFLKRQRERLKGEAEAVLDKDPVYRAIAYLQDGELPGGTPAALKDEKGNSYKLDQDALRRKYDVETVRKLPRGIFAPKGEKGASADDLAELLGFQSGRDLVGQLLTALPRKDVLKARVEQQMETIHGAALKDAPQALQDAASDALHNEDSLQKVLIERRKLMELVAPGKGGHTLDLSPEYLRKTAQDLVARKTVDELVGGRDGAAGYFLRAERTATQRMRKSFEAGKYEDALAENERVLVNMHLYREARDARERLETAQAALEQSADAPWRSVLGKADVAATPEGKPNDHAFLGAHDAILQATGFQPAAGAPDLASVDKILVALGTNVAFDPDVLRELIAHPTMWGELTADQAENVLAAVKNIRHGANAQLKFELVGKQMDRASWFEEAQQHALKTAQLEPRAPTKSGETAAEKIAAAIRGGDAWLTSVATYVDTLDGGDRDGPWHRLFVDEYRDARQKLVELDRDIVGRVLKAIEQMPKSLRARADEDVPGLPALLPPDARYSDRVRGLQTRSDLWSLFLNSGNADNLQRLRDGNGWSDDARQQALQLLTPQEARFLQGLLDTIDSLHPELAKVYERRKGLPLGKVAATPIVINGETFRGGYFPIRYDPSISRQGAVQMADVEKKLFDVGYNSPTVYSGHTKERMDTVLAPLSMEFGSTQAHLAQVVQDIAMGDFVRAAGSMVLDPRFSPIVDKALGQERTKLFMPLLKDIAADRAGSTTAAAEGQPGFIRTLMAVGRSRYARGVMALNLPSMLAHLTDPLAAIGEAEGPVAMAERTARIVPAYLKTVASLKSGRGEYSLSKELAYRDARETANIRKELDRVKLPENVFLRGAARVSDVADHVSTLTRHYLDMFHAKVLWQTGFDEAVAKGHTRDEAARLGDDLLAKTLPSGDMAEKSSIMRSKHDLAAVVTFYGYANRMWNLWVHAPISRSFDAWRGPESSFSSKARSVGDLTAKWLVMGAVAALGAKLAGRGPTDEDDKKALLLQGWGPTGWLARRVLLEPANSIPILGPVLEQVADGKQVSVRTAPAAEVLADTASKLEKAIEKARNGEGPDQLVWEILGLTTGTLLGPTGQLRRTGGYLRDVAAGQLPRQDASDVAKGLVYGPPRH